VQRLLPKFTLVGFQYSGFDCSKSSFDCFRNSRFVASKSSFDCFGNSRFVGFQYTSFDFFQIKLRLIQISIASNDSKFLTTSIASDIRAPRVQLGSSNLTNVPLRLRVTILDEHLTATTRPVTNFGNPYLPQSGNRKLRLSLSRRPLRSS